MVKSRTNIRLKEAVLGKKSRNRSEDLDGLIQQYKYFTDKLTKTIESLKHHHECMVSLSDSRVEIANNIASLSEKTPMDNCTGRISEEEDSIVPSSYRSIHVEFQKRSKAYSDKFNQYILNYVIEWEKVVTTRIDKGIKNTELLRRDLDHYQKKVEDLRKSTNLTLAKGKQVDVKTAEKLGRNEEKLLKAKEQYNKFCTDMCILVEEVTQRCWKDLHPMLIKLAQFDTTLANDEAKAFSNLNQVVDSLKRLAEQHGLSPSARLKDLAEKRPIELSSNPDGYQQYQIEDGPSSNISPSGSAEIGASGIIGGAGSGSSSDWAAGVDQPAMQPGSVAPQGMGGFPVMVSSSGTATGGGGSDSGGGFGSRANSTGSFDSNPGASSYPPPYAPAPSSGGMTMPSTNDMVNSLTHSAPPPSLDQINNDTGMMTISGGHGSNSNMYGDYGPNRSRTSTGGSLHSANRSLSGSYHGGSNNDLPRIHGPPPSEPPPPPPPPTGLSMYGSSTGNIPVATAITSSGSINTNPFDEGRSSSGYGGGSNPPMMGGGGGMMGGGQQQYGQRNPTNPFG